MLKRIDEQLIKHHQKESHKPYRKFAGSKLGFILATLFSLKQSVDETLLAREEGELALSGIFVVISVLLALYAIRHIFFRKKIERFEYRMKVAEAFIVLYVAIQKWQHLWFAEGERGIRIYMLPLFSILLFFFYLGIARIIFLKHSGRIVEEEG